MGMLMFKRIFFRSFVESSGATQAVFTFLLIPCCLTQDFTAPPLIPNISFLWGWNVPTERCATQFNVQLDLSLFSITGSPLKSATGQAITLFYADRLGYYPHISEKTGQSIHGGIPQLGSLQKHLHKAKNDISHYIETEGVGLAVIDWENWRPIWARNWKPKDIYKRLSIELVHHQHVQLNDTEAAERAKVDFENAGKCFMLKTLKLGKSLRPNYLWGYYLFPDCYNHNIKNPSYNGSCPDVEYKRNDELNWLWNESTALFPSIYLNSKLKSSPNASLFVRNRVQEAIRVSKVSSAKQPLPVFVYTRPVFTDLDLKYLSEGDLVNTIGETVSLGVSGMIIWGSLNFSQNVQSCTELDSYMKNTLNPYLINVTLAAKMCNQVLCQERGVCARKNWNSSDYLHLNPVSFTIQLEKSGNYTVHGKPTLEDLQEFSNKFYCLCYANVNCKERADMAKIHTVKVCMAEDICIDAFLNAEPSDYHSRWKKHDTLGNILSSILPSTASPCVPGQGLSRCRKARFLARQTRADSKTTQVGY
ncbi:hyaluronidase PH-20 [Felis catus]|uniref:Hyaluronidase n=1 Tax=Felis catus TaxID=9685 RepID=A0ABI7W2S8_FELCA|nr:hyaluronidase PH-20 [Felis catus]XP_044908633.1 hyaluronidase PH-20 [Felis catus]XP_044908634.1 hyaluronidase PH-20 [Felis catus]